MADRWAVAVGHRCMGPAGTERGRRDVRSEWLAGRASVDEPHAPSHLCPRVVQPAGHAAAPSASVLVADVLVDPGRTAKEQTP